MSKEKELLSLTGSKLLVETLRKIEEVLGVNFGVEI